MPIIKIVSGGSKKTIEFAKKHGKPVLHIPIDQDSRQESSTGLSDGLRVMIPIPVRLTRSGVIA